MVILPDRALQSVFYVKVIEFARSGQCVAFQILDVLVHAVVDAVDDLFHLLRRAFHDEFDSAIGEVADITEDVVT